MLDQEARQRIISSMEPLPELTQLRAIEKDALIGALWTCVVALTATVAERQAHGRLAKNRRNASQPPASDGLNTPPPPQSLRTRGEQPTGGQKGHTGHARQCVAPPDWMETEAPASHGDVGQRALDRAVVVETRQVFDPPSLRGAVTEHRLRGAPCRSGKVWLTGWPRGRERVQDDEMFENWVVGQND